MLSLHRTLEQVSYGQDGASQTPDRGSGFRKSYKDGYLTIKGYDPEFRTYTLGFPNEEVAEGFTKCLMPNYIYPKERQSPFLIDNFDSRTRNIDRFAVE